MTPVMARCSCQAAYALAECIICTPTPPGGRNPDHRQPIQPLLPRTPTDDAGLTVDHGDTQAAADLAVRAAVLTGAIIGGGIAALTAAIEHLLGKRRP